MEEGQRSERDERELMARTRLGQLLVTQPGFIDELLLDLDKTRYEELTCVGLQPDQATLYATIAVKQDFGYGGDLCTGPGGREYVRFFADWNPVSAVTQAARELFGNVDPHAAGGAWSLNHPVVYSLIWVGIILAVFVPLSVRRYQQKANK